LARIFKLTKNTENNDSGKVDCVFSIVHSINRKKC